MSPAASRVEASPAAATARRARVVVSLMVSPVLVVEAAPAKPGSAKVQAVAPVMA